MVLHRRNGLSTAYCGPGCVPDLYGDAIASSEPNIPRNLLRKTPSRRILESHSLRENQFFIPNYPDWYSLGDRSAIRYPNGTLVYGGGSPGDSSEPFQLLLQSTDVPPSEFCSKRVPKHATSSCTRLHRADTYIHRPSWLPTPFGDSIFYVNRESELSIRILVFVPSSDPLLSVRWYQPTEGLFNGTYRYPKFNLLKDVNHVVAGDAASRWR